MLKSARDQLERINKAIAEFESMPETKRYRYQALLHALYDQRRDLLRPGRPEKVSERAGLRP